jgi:DNA processing protein
MAHDDLADWLRLLETPGIGLDGARRLLAAFASPAGVFAAPPAARAAVVGASLGETLDQAPPGFDAQLDKTLAWLDADVRHDILVLGDPDYPPSLLNTADPPLLLYLRGRRELLGLPALAIVGSRNPTAQGRENAHDFAATLASAGLCIVSGLALGIDAAAHQGALMVGAPTLAVVGTGLDQVYPPRNAALAAQIAERGLIVSEYALGTPPLGANFPRRNRIIAGLAQGCLVVEAALRSGSLITARLASEAGREVFAIPGSIHSPQSHGCHALIRQGAKLVERADDVLEELQLPRLGGPDAVSAETPAGAGSDLGVPDRAAAVLEAMGYEPVGLDALQARGGWATAELSALLLELELAGAVARLPGSLFQRRHLG